MAQRRRDRRCPAAPHKLDVQARFSPGRARSIAMKRRPRSSPRLAAGRGRARGHRALAVGAGAAQAGRRPRRPGARCRCRRVLAMIAQRYPGRQLNTTMGRVPAAGRSTSSSGSSPMAGSSIFTGRRRGRGQDRCGATRAARITPAEPRRKGRDHAHPARRRRSGPVAPAEAGAGRRRLCGRPRPRRRGSPVPRRDRAL